MNTIIKPSDATVAQTETNTDSTATLIKAFINPPLSNGSIRFLSHGFNATIPKVDEKDRRKPMSATINGLTIPRISAAKPSEFTGSAFRLNKLPARITKSIIPALQTDGEKPVTPIKNKVKAIPIDEFSLFLTPISSSIAYKPITQTDKCIPETANTGATPAALIFPRSSVEI